MLIALAAAGVIVTIVWLLARQGGAPVQASGEGSSPKRAAAGQTPAPAGTAPAAATVAAGPECTVRVNGSPYARSAPGSPIYVECVFVSPSAAQPAAAPKQVTLQVTAVVGNEAGVGAAGNEAGAGAAQETPAELEPLGDRPAVASAAGAPLVWRWKLSSALAEGSYEVRAVLPEGWSPRPARLDVAARHACKSWDQRVARRIAAWQGRREKVVSELESAVAADAGNLSARLELIDHLQAADKPEAARDQLLDLAYRIQQKQLAGSPGQSPDLPDWIAFGLESLAAAQR